jgi:hypothetical protein
VAGPAARILSPSQSATDGAIAPRGERRGSLVLTAGPVPDSYRRYPTGPVDASLPDERSGFLAPLPPCGGNRGTERPGGHDANGRQSGGTQAGRAGSRSRIANVRPGNLCPTTPWHTAGESQQNQRRPARPQPPLRVPRAIARLDKRLPMPALPPTKEHRCPEFRF